jgi:hypothetical protein
VNTILLRLSKINSFKEVPAHLAAILIINALGVVSSYVWDQIGPDGVLGPYGIFIIVFVLGNGVYIWYQRNKDVRLEDRLDLGQFALDTDGAQTVRVLNTFVPEPESVAEILVKAASNKANVCLLLLGPNTKEADLRAKALSETDDDIVKKIVATLEAVEKSLNRIQGVKPQVQVRLCNIWVPFSLYATEDVARVGYFLVGELAVRGPQLIVRKHHPQFSKFEGQFQALWDHKGNSACLPMLDRERWWQLVMDYCRR